MAKLAQATAVESEVLSAPEVETMVVQAMVVATAGGGASAAVKKVVVAACRP